MSDQDRILRVDIENEMKSDYIDYSMSVIVARALPDVRDGLKPVHRRVLFGMNEMGNTSDKPHKKSANCVGEVMGKYHPHGDSSIYGTVVRMAQNWAMRYTLVDGHGNFGSIDGDGPAAMRYTEVRLRQIGEEMLSDIDSDTVDFVPNYDNQRREPVVLPTRIPNLLINGASGIAVGMATNMPTHNLTESINACVAIIDNPDITIPELMHYITAPDFPTGGIIYGYDGVREAFETGRGRIVIRARAEIETHDNHDEIIVKEIPYGVNKAELIKQIAQLAIDKKVDSIADVNDESDYTGMRIVVKVKAGENANVLLNKLYKMTQLQSSFSVNNVALVKGRPRTLNLKEILNAFVEHRHEVVLRRTRFELGKAEERAHILQGLIVAVQNIDEVIEIIRSSSSTDDAKIRLGERFNLDDIQTQAIVDMRLKQLTQLEIDKLQQNYDEIMELIRHLNEILDNPEVCWSLIKDELIEIRDKYGDERRTSIDYTAGNFNADDFYANDEMVITISNLGYIKRTALQEYRTQNRGGVGSKGSDTRDEDFIKHVFTATNHNYMMFFTQRGKCYWMKVYDIPEGAKNTKGRAIQNLLDIDKDDSVKAFIALRDLKNEFVDNYNFVFCTKKGFIKKTSLKEYIRYDRNQEIYSKPKTNGLSSIVIRDDDELLQVELTDGNYSVLLANRNGRAVWFNEAQVRNMGRNSMGVIGMRLDNDDDAIVGMICVPTDTTDDIMVISENGYGKRSKLEDYRMTNRGTKGVKTLNITDKTGYLIAFKNVNDNNDLIVINKSGITLRVKVADFRVMGRATQGVKAINLEKRNDVIASICRVDSSSDDEEPEANDADAPTNDGEELNQLPENESNE
ncbi:MAG: DNA gyrase subunit A [Muribaculaceae bacterium]|nr:DNA gyrase subunit A [Muribaculaceae bacterium]